MKESEEKITGQKVLDDATMNFVSRQAQEAILDPHLPEYFKDNVVDAAVKTLLRIAEKGNSYNAKQRESQQSKRSHIIYEAEEDRSSLTGNKR